MKIIGGKFKGRNFYRSEGIRPTQNITRSALFDILGHDLEGMTFLDLFAGSGAVGLEAFSRGALNVTFVEKDPMCAAVIGENIKLLLKITDDSLRSSCKVIQTDAFAAIKLFASQKQTFNAIFIDPPYGRGLAKKALKVLKSYDILSPACPVIIQHEKKEILPENQGSFLLFRQKRYGSTMISIYKTS